MDDRAASRRPRRRRAWILPGLVALPLVVAGGSLLILQRSTVGRLSRLEAAADASDPQWRLGDLLAARATVPDSENSALQVEAAHKLLPAGWMANQAADPPTTAAQRLATTRDLLAPGSDLEPNQALLPPVGEQLRNDLADLGPALAEARALAGMPQGRWPLDPAPVFVHMAEKTWPRIGRVRDVARLLHLDAAARADQGDIAGALDDVRAILNAGRSISDEPLITSQLVRIAVNGIALATLQRTLAQGEPNSDTPLEQLARLLAEEAAAPVLLHALRGERAGVADTLGRLASGELTPHQAFAPAGGPPADGPSFGPPRVYFRFNQAIFLEGMNEAIAIARLPSSEQLARWDAWEAMFRRAARSRIDRNLGVLAYLTLESVRPVGDAELRNHALLNVGRMMVALERFRLARGQWPETAEELVPDFLPELPDDPFSGAAIRVARTDDGLVVYSVGPDGEDDGGALDPTFRPHGDLDWGLRLWNVDQRHQPPAPALPALPDDVFAP